MKTLRWTSHDLESLPDPLDGRRYEIIDGDLYMSKQPHWEHQLVCGEIFAALHDWSRQTGAGRANFAPGVIFADDDDVVPDVVWISKQRLATALYEDGKLHKSPELVIEVLSPGSANERRDRDFKLKLYSRRGADEYWIIDWLQRCVEVYRRENAVLLLHSTLYANDVLQSPLLPGFHCQVGQLFTNM